MKYYGKAEETAHKILNAFRTGNIPDVIGKVVISRDLPMKKWSYMNRTLCFIGACTDARGYRQWKEIGRHVKKGEKSQARILIPLFAKKENDEGEEEEFLYGFKGIPVFDVSQTEGEPLKYEEEEQEIIANLPLLAAAAKMDIRIQTYDISIGDAYGYYSPFHNLIALATTSPLTWLHELVHAADHRNRGGNITRDDPEWKTEAVAQLGAAVLARLLELPPNEQDVGYTWKYISSYAKRAGKDPIKVCVSVLNRTCEAVEYILDTAREADPAKEEVLA